jgi:MFS family permease
VLGRLVPSAYRPPLADRFVRRLILGFAVSYLGDGMSFVAVAWLAIALAPHATVGLWVGGAVAAYTLPGVLGALVFGRRLRRVPARRLLLADNVVRGVFLGAIPFAWLAGALTPPLYVVLLAVSSLLHAWGNAGKYTLLAELLPDEQRLAANTLVSSLSFAAMIAGPAIAGVLVRYANPAVVPAWTLSPTCSSPCLSCAPGCRSPDTSPSSTRRPAAAGWRCCAPIPSCSGC